MRKGGPAGILGSTAAGRRFWTRRFFRTADFQVSRIAGFLTRRRYPQLARPAPGRSADWACQSPVTIGQPVPLCENTPFQGTWPAGWRHPACRPGALTGRCERVSASMQVAVLPPHRYLRLLNPRSPASPTPPGRAHPPSAPESPVPPAFGRPPPRR